MIASYYKGIILGGIRVSQPLIQIEWRQPIHIGDHVDRHWHAIHASDAVLHLLDEAVTVRDVDGPYTNTNRGREKNGDWNKRDRLS